jgi:Tol biopolymer transport system component
MKISVGVFAGISLGLCLMTGCGSGNTSTGAVHPVNGKIAFTRDEVSLSGVFMSPVTDIWVMNPDGSNQQNLTKGNVASFSPAWSPDGKKIVYANDGIWIMNADGSRQHQINTAGISPSWSHDGAKIAFVLGGEVEVMNSDGTKLQNLTNEHVGLNCFKPVWSPDDFKIAFTKFDKSLWIMLANGSNREQIAADATGTAWSPDGKKIAYSHLGTDLWIVNVDGSNPHNLTNDNDSNNSTGGPSWSPDGTQIVFEKRTTLSDPVTGNRSSIWTMNADGSNHKSLNLLPTANTSEPAWGTAQ